MTQIQLAQTEKILTALSTWCSEDPGRRVVLRHNGERWSVELDERRPQSGETLLDAMAQAATVCAVENEMREEIGE